MAKTILIMQYLHIMNLSSPVHIKKQAEILHPFTLVLVNGSSMMILAFPMYHPFFPLAIEASMRAIPDVMRGS